MNKNIFENFVAAINEHNIDKIYSMMTDDHLFIDSCANEIIGKEKMRSGWVEYLRWFPDYKAVIKDIFIENNMIGAFGFASGSYICKKSGNAENHFHLPAAWRAVIENKKIKLWQVYADTKIQLGIIERNK